MFNNTIGLEIIHSSIDNKIKKYKVSFVVPDYDQMANALKSGLDYEDLDYCNFVLNMLKLHFTFEGEYILRTQAIDLKELLARGMVSLNIIYNPEEKLEFNRDGISELINNATYAGTFPEMTISEHGYYKFRDMLLDEVKDINLMLDEMIEGSLNKVISEARMLDKLKFRYKRYIRKKPLENHMEGVKRDIFKMLIEVAQQLEFDLVSKKYYNRARSLLKAFDETEYLKLLDEVIYTFTKMDENKEKKFYQEQIACLTEGKCATTQEDINGYLIWIIDNTNSRNEAFKFALLEAEELYLSFLDWFYRQEYRRLRGKMNKAGRRAFQLLFFRRETFGNRIPVHEPLFLNFIFNLDEEVSAGIILSLVFKVACIDGIDIKTEINQCWMQYLKYYPNLYKLAELNEMFLDKEAVIKKANKLFSKKEAEILKCFLENNSPDIISIKFDLQQHEVAGILARLASEIANGRIYNEIENDERCNSKT